MDRNTTTFDSTSFYKKAQADGLVSHQFSNLTAFTQYNEVYQTTLKFVRPGNRALDWGAGSGHFAYFLLSQGLQVTTFSFSPDAPEVLKRFNHAAHVTGDMTEPVNLPFHDETFDHVFSIGVLEHVHETGGDQFASMLEIKRILRPGGRFLCFHFPNEHGWVEPLKGRLMPGSHAHSRRFSKSDIIQLCRRTDLELLETGQYNFLPRNEIARILGPLANTRLGAWVFNGLDRFLTKLMPRYATNFYFVARRVR